MRLSSLIALSLISVLSHAQDISSLCYGPDRNQLSFAGASYPQPRDHGELSVITWNAHKFSDRQFLPDLRRLSETTDVILIQEAMHSSGWQKELISLTAFDFSFHKSFCMLSKRATGVINSSRFQLFNNLTLPSPGVEPLALTHKVSAYSQILVDGQVIHIINTHALNFNIGGPFERQVYQIAKFISKLSGPVIWAGDFNTWNSIRYEYLMRITTALKLKHLLPEHDTRRLKLDHIFIRGLTPVATEVLKEDSSDHFPLKTVLKTDHD